MSEKVNEQEDRDLAIGRDEAEKVRGGLCIMGPAKKPYGPTAK